MKRRNSEINWYRILIVLISVAIIISIGFSIKTIVTLHLEKNILDEENQKLRDERDQLILELENANTAEFIEEQARLQLKLIKPDEILFILPEDKDEED